MNTKVSTYVIVENAGYFNERDVRNFPNYWSAFEYMTDHYEDDEIVEIRHDVTFNDELVSSEFV